MTLYSMTGFGAARAEATLGDGAQLSVTAEARSVNHRHLQAKIRLPHEFAALESSLDKLVRSKLARGAVQISVEVTRTGGEPGFDIDEAAVERYLRLQRGIVRRFTEFDLAEVDSVTEILGLPGVVVTKRGRSEVEATGDEAQLVTQVVGEALDALAAMRETEGAAMGADVAKSGDAVEELVGQVSDRMPNVVTEHRAKLVERVRELAGDTQVSEADLAREIALIADRLDVAEEIARLASHLDQLRSVLNKGGAVGRQLDFLAQEFFREANTIGSKCNNAAVAHLVVDLKTHVERLREQVQNIE